MNIEGKIATLTEAEQQVIRIMCEEGLSTNALGKRLDIKVNTVYKHLASIRNKLGLKKTNRLGLAQFAYQYGLARRPDGR